MMRRLMLCLVLAPPAWALADWPQFAELSPTEKWKDGLPAEVLRQCCWWAEHLVEVPIGVRETYRYDRASDTLSVQGQIDSLPLRPHGGHRFAPLPPMLAVAAREKFSLLKVEGSPSESGFWTKWGPYAGIEDANQYGWSVRGLGKYVFEVRPMIPRERADAIRRSE